MKIKGLVPMLETEKLRETVAFYSDVLGFEARDYYPDEENACWVSVWNGDCEIGFGLKSEQSEVPGIGMTGSLYMHVGNIDEMWERVKDKADIMFEPQDMAYDMREFGIADPNGYAIIFGQDISKK